MYELVSTDYKLLKFISKNGSVDLETITKKFKDIDGIELRLRKLRSERIIIQPQNMSKHGFYTEVKLEPIYSLTDLGKVKLQNYEQQLKNYKREIWLKNVWIPIIVAFATTLLTNYLLPKLSQLLQWFANIL